MIGCDKVSLIVLGLTKASRGRLCTLRRLGVKNTTAWRLLSEYESVGLLYRLSDTLQALLGVCSSRSIGAWLSDDIPCSDYFKHYLSICAIVDECLEPQNTALSY